MLRSINHTRRRLLSASLWALGSSALAAPLQILTPAQTRGPFYPRQLPLDKDNDLVTVAGRPGLARGEITHIVGRVLDQQGRAAPHARVEIWQCDANGRYHHPGDRNDAPLDPNFQGYGHFVTGADGAYRFRTIKPVPYPGRTPHIHFAISAPGFKPLVTQMYIAGVPENERDWILNNIPAKARQSVLVALAPWEGGPELIGNFDIVLRAS